MLANGGYLVAKEHDVETHEPNRKKKKRKEQEIEKERKKSKKKENRKARFFAAAPNI